MAEIAMDNSRSQVSSNSTHATGREEDLLQGNYAFLVHSQQTVNGNLPPVIDNHPLARQKRRRTR